MTEYVCLGSEEIAGLLSLVGELGRLSEPAERQRMLLRRLCAMTGATRGMIVRAEWHDVSQRPGRVVHVIREGAEEPEWGQVGPMLGDMLDEAVLDAEELIGETIRRGGATQQAVEIRRAVGGEQAIVCAGWNEGHYVCGALMRPGGEAHRFTRREAEILELAREGMGWAWVEQQKQETTPLEKSASDHGLPGRLVKTFELLMGSDGEKQIAAKLGFTYSTVHEYVKQIYRHFDVSSRAELMARVMGEGAMVGVR